MLSSHRSTFTHCHYSNDSLKGRNIYKWRRGWDIYREEIVEDKDKLICHLSNVWHLGNECLCTIVNIRRTKRSFDVRPVVHSKGMGCTFWNTVHHVIECSWWEKYRSQWKNRSFGVLNKRSVNAKSQKVLTLFGCFIFFQLFFEFMFGFRLGQTKFYSDYPTRLNYPTLCS